MGGVRVMSGSDDNFLVNPTSLPLVHILTFELSTLLYTREADDTKEQIEKKCQALSAADAGSDLFSVQALQRQHEGFERDLVPLGDKVRQVLQSFSNTFHFIFNPIPMPSSLVLFFGLLFLYFSLFHICFCTLSLRQDHEKDMPHDH